MTKHLNRTKTFAIICAMIALVLSIAAAPREAQAAQGGARIHILPFKYSDAILVESDGHFGMVDSGEDNSYPDGSDSRYPLRDGITKGAGHEDEVISYLESVGVTTDNFDFYIGTHPHSDHIGSAQQIIKRFKPKKIYTPIYDDGYITDPSRLWDNRYVYDRLIEAAKEAHEEYGAELVQSFGRDGSGFYLDSAYIQLYNTDASYQTKGVFDANCFSLGVKVTAGGYTAFLAGDINNCTGVEDRLATELGHIDFLKMGHHGIEGSNSRPYLEAIFPRLVFQTGDFSVLPTETIDAIARLEAKYASSDDVADAGLSAYVVNLTSKGLATNLSMDVGRLYYSSSKGSYLYYKNGAQASGSGWARLESGWTWLDGSSAVNTSRWVWNGGAWYWIKSNGLMATGWQSVGPNWYYFEAGGNMIVGWKKIDGAWSYFDSSGAMHTGWLNTGGRWYWLDGSGAMKVGWRYINGSWYYFSGDGGMNTGWLNLDGTWYFLDASGAMQVGWRYLNGAWYYLDGSGAMKTGWQLINGNWYYMFGSGAMAHDCWVGNYFLTSSGAMAVSSRVGGYWVGADGAWVPGV